MREWLPGLNARLKWFQVQRDFQMVMLCWSFHWTHLEETGRLDGLSKSIQGIRWTCARCKDTSQIMEH